MSLTNVDSTALRRAVYKLGENAHELAGVKVAAKVRSAAPVSTVTPTSVGRPGRLRDSIKVLRGRRIGQSITSTITAPVPYASFVDKGTSSHPIVGSPLLRFWWKGPNRGRRSRTGIYYFRRVNHPGTKANRFWSKNVTGAAWVRALTEAVRGISVKA